METQKKSFNLKLEGNILYLSFGETATGQKIVQDIVEALENIDFPKGKLLKVNGACTVAGAYVISSKVANLFGTIAVFDPKLGQYLVAINKNPEFKIGQTID